MMAVGCYAQTLGPYTAAVNTAADLYGPVDTRPGCWGNAQVASWTTRFAPPAGYRVKILEIHGDLISWIETLPGDTTVVTAQSTAGVLLSLQTSDPVNSGRCDVCADVVRAAPSTQAPAVQSTTMLYIQDSVAQLMPKSRASYDRPAVNALLNADNQLIVTVASWLNTTGKLIHIEPTFIVTYEFEPVSGSTTVAPMVAVVRSVK